MTSFIITDIKIFDIIKQMNKDDLIEFLVLNKNSFNDKEQCESFLNEPIVIERNVI